MENISFYFIETDEKGRYDILTVDKAASYLISGWVMFSEETIPEAFLKLTSEHDSRTIKMKKMSKGGVYFSGKVFLLKGNKISIYFDSNYTDSLFHVYEVWGWNQTSVVVVVLLSGHHVYVRQATVLSCQNLLTSMLYIFFHVCTCQMVVS